MGRHPHGHSTGRELSEIHHVAQVLKHPDQAYSYSVDDVVPYVHEHLTDVRKAARGLTRAVGETRVDHRLLGEDDAQVAQPPAARSSMNLLNVCSPALPAELVRIAGSPQADRD